MLQQVDDNTFDTQGQQNAAERLLTQIANFNSEVTSLHAAITKLHGHPCTPECRIRTNALDDLQGIAANLAWIARRITNEAEDLHHALDVPWQ